MIQQHHIPVLLEETIEALQVSPGGRYIDCTVGEGGHAAAILERSAPGGQVLGLDADPEAIKVAQAKLQKHGGEFLLINGNFNRLEEICSGSNFRPVHGILFDLGMSSLQLEEGKQGFSFQRDAPLDMRFNPNQELAAAEIINNLPEQELARTIWEYGEEHRSRRIAKYIVKNRPIGTTLELAEIVAQAVDGRRGRIHPATKTFQALRIAVNQELENLKLALEQTVDLLGFGGRLVIIAFHSLEDRIVKEFLRQEKMLKIVTKKVIRPGLEEVRQNPRSRSAKLRVAERQTMDEGR